MAAMRYYLSAEERSTIPPLSLPVLLNEETERFSLAGKRAVIVEDEGITQLQLAKILRSAGIQVVGAAGTGKEGVEIVLREHPDLVLMDIRMPIMDGIEAAERILEKERICIVMLTAFSDEEYRQRAATLRTCGYVLKPVTADILLPELKAAYWRFHQP